MGALAGENKGSTKPDFRQESFTPPEGVTKIFVSRSHGRLLLKLPAERVDSLIESGIGERFSTGAARPKREWVTISASCASRWIELSEEACVFVAARGRKD